MTESAELDIDGSLPEMQALATRIWSRESRHHPGQLAWSARYALPEDLDHGPVRVLREGGTTLAWAWAESPDWLEVCVDPDRPELVAGVAQSFLDGAGPDATVRTMVLETEAHLLDGLGTAGFEVEDTPWFTHHFLDLGDLVEVPEVAGYTLRHVEPGEHEARSACHRSAWTPPGGSSKVTSGAYERLMRTPPYDPHLDWVAVDGAGEMVASCLVWLDATTGVALVEPVGCAPEHSGRGLAGAVSLAALHAARRAGGRTGMVCPRGDDGYPQPQRIYRGIGFEPGPRTLTLRRG